MRCLTASIALDMANCDTLQLESDEGILDDRAQENVVPDNCSVFLRLTSAQFEHEFGSDIRLYIHVPGHSDLNLFYCLKVCDYTYSASKR